MAAETIYEREQQSVTLATKFRDRMKGIQRAMASIAEGGGVTFPTWFLACVTASLLAATGVFMSTAWSLSQTVSVDHVTITNQGDRIRALETMTTDVATLKADVGSIKDTAEHTDAKVDKLVERELERGHP